MGPQQTRLRVLRVKPLPHKLRPQPPRSPQLSNLHIKVHSNSEKERETRSNIINLQPSFNTGVQIFETITNGVGQFGDGVGAGFLLWTGRGRGGEKEKEKEEEEREKEKEKEREKKKKKKIGKGKGKGKGKENILADGIH